MCETRCLTKYYTIIENVVGTCQRHHRLPTVRLCACFMFRAECPALRHKVRTIRNILMRKSCSAAYRSFNNDLTANLRFCIALQICAVHKKLCQAFEKRGGGGIEQSRPENTQNAYHGIIPGAPIICCCILYFLRPRSLTFAQVF